jgi:uncharacterized protein
MVITALQMKENFEKLFTARFVSILIVSSVVGIVLFSLYFQSHTQQVLRARKEKDRYFGSAFLSPIPDKSEFVKLKYFAPNEAYKVIAKMEIFTDEQFVSMWSSDGKKVNYQKFAKIYFKINNIECTSLVFKNTESKDSTQLFMPFRDLSNGKFTYQSGRYLDLVWENNHEIVLDFNLAYNPYCAYNYKYSCPLAPKENKLMVNIEAGEKIY